ncbi:MAG: hypothetical protein M3P40_10005 [Actinomycetota bacterium]|nr:hypothetical protein [Actinomycetota bacterium]
MADKTSNSTVNYAHRVYLDPEHGLQLPRAEDLADKGVVTASTVTVQPGEQVKAAPDKIEGMRAAGVVADQK